jgi:hypothetical protein
MVFEWRARTGSPKGVAVSTETQLSAPIHVTPSQVPPAQIHVAPVQSSRTGSFAVPAPATSEENSGPLTWASPTSDRLPLVGTAQQPRMRQLMGVCGWAAVLGGLGLVIGIRGFIGDLMGQAPGWYEAAMIIIGILGIGLTVGAFVTVNRGRLPYALLGGASAVLLIALTITANAF